MVPYDPLYAPAELGPPRRNPWVGRLIVLAVLGVLAGGVAWLSRRWIVYYTATQRFTPEALNAFGAVAYERAPDADPDAPLYRVGRVAIIHPPVLGRDVGSQHGHDIVRPAELAYAHAALPDFVRARGPEHVDTLVVIRTSLHKWKEEELARVPVIRTRDGEVIAELVTTQKRYDPESAVHGRIYDLTAETLIGEFVLVADGTEDPDLADFIAQLPAR